MEAPAVVALVLLALAIGAAFGAWCAWPPPSPLPVEGAEGATPSPLASTLPPEAPPVEPPPPVPAGLLGRFLPPARAAAAALAETDALPSEAMAQVLAGVAADHWILGVSELRQALVDHSGLSPETGDHLANLAILALEARHAERG